MSKDISSRIAKMLACRFLDRWTREFCDSIRIQVEKGYKLSEKQINIFEKKEKIFCPDPKTVALKEEKYARWVSNWDADKKNAFEVCARYYTSDKEVRAYYSSITSRIVWHDGPVESRKTNWEATAIPSEFNYRKLVENKYAKKVLKNFYSAAKFAVGSPVQIRNNQDTRWRLDPQLMYLDAPKFGYMNRGVLTARPYIVIDNSDPGCSPYKRRRNYCVLGAGHATPINIEERYLMKAKKLKPSKKKSE